MRLEILADLVYMVSHQQLGYSIGCIPVAAAVLCLGDILLACADAIRHSRNQRGTIPKGAFESALFMTVIISCCI